MKAPIFRDDIDPKSIPKVFVVIGPPGCGKTTHLAKISNEAARRFGGSKILLASLTRTAAAEIGSRFAVGTTLMPIPKSQVGTLHSHAYAALGHPQIVEDKHLADFNEYVTKQAEKASLQFSAQQFKMTTTGHAKSCDEPRSGPVTSTRTKGNQLYQDLCLMRSKCLPESMWIKEDLRFFAKQWADWKLHCNLLDFEDLIEFAANDTKHAPGRPEALYLDESQDLSTSEFKLVLNWAQNAGSICVVGDPDQALYRWRGADPDAFLWLASEHPSRKGIPREKYRKILAQSYRVPEAVHSYAVKWINLTPGREPVEYHPTENPGQVLYRPDFDIDSEELIEWSLRKFEGKSIMFLASCDYLLTPLIRFLRARGIPFHNPYRVVRGDWNPLRSGGRVLNFLRPDEEAWGERARQWTWREFWNWLEIIDTDWLCRGAKSVIRRMGSDENTKDLLIADSLFEAEITVGNSFQDPKDYIRSDLRNFRRLLKRTKKEKESAKELALTSEQKRLDYIFRLCDRFGPSKLREDPKVILGTVHSVKGGEADVVIVSPDLSPEGFATWNYGCGPGANDVRRLFYVAFTRAKDTLVVIGGRNQLAVHLPPP